MLDLQIRILKLLISLLNSKFILTLEYHISLDWKFLSSLIYTLGFSQATLQFFGSKVDSGFECRMIFISIIVSTILMLISILVQKTTCTQFGKPSLLGIGYDTQRCYHIDESSLFNHAQPNKAPITRNKLWVQNS